ncbi:hypothetical protein [Actinoplanes sp. NPDC026623]|uniref:hypothetical protein n=1 Tax=Actinoplanes sp. NPDC026623 TaxID=3155610 RepID=UPI0033F1E753
MASRRRVRRAALIALGTVVAVSTGVAVLTARRGPGAEPEPALPVPAPPVPAPPRERPGRAMPAATPVRRNWAALIAVPVVAIVVLTVAQVATWPTPHQLSAADRARLESSLAALLTFPSVPSFTFPVQQQCSPPADRTPPYPTSGFNDIARDGLGVPPCVTLALGATTTIARYSGESVEVTATMAVDPEVQPTVLPLPDGRHRILFRIHTRNVGTSTIQTPFRFVWAAAPGSGWMSAAASSQAGVWLNPGEETDQFEAFDVSGNARLARLRLSLLPGSVYQTVDWVLG